MSNYKIMKCYVVNPNSGSWKLRWDVVDASDNWVIDSFSLRRDAKAWIERAEADQREADEQLGRELANDLRAELAGL